MTNSIEGGPERILTKAEVVEVMVRYAENGTVARELYDEQDGLYLLEIKVEGKKAGESTEYTYRRKGTFGKNATLTTHIDVAYYEDNIPVGGSNISEFDYETGEWLEVK